MSLLTFALLLALATAGIAPAEELGGLSPPTHRVQVLADTRVEEPPTYSGITYAPLPGPGGRVEVQVFMPDVAGRLAFGYIVEFDDRGGGFSDVFEIGEAYTWAVANILDASGWRQIARRIDMPAPVGSRGPGRSILFTHPPTVPASGLIGTFVLNASGTPAVQVPLRFTVSAAVYSVTPPSRIWHFHSDQAIFWR